LSWDHPLEGGSINIGKLVIFVIQITFSGYIRLIEVIFQGYYG
jgi:hypothetical protein